MVKKLLFVLHTTCEQENICCYVSSKGLLINHISNQKGEGGWTDAEKTLPKGGRGSAKCQQTLRVQGGVEKEDISRKKISQIHQKPKFKTQFGIGGRGIG